ncbi:hypothetical protein BJ138DRAFT_1116514 [Hygrophoropsis aurantiaca]|uniref:Uncharacterized protein n=1 Tax=Hygrophoropsis aurantiaca TaxID=72124 RepID=A0ACB8A3V2_9AGAM|nr:hypothetical protein BJ138DRAFT_1116514 [Hygrophoropsis aurantiaca]
MPRSNRKAATKQQPIAEEAPRLPFPQLLSRNLKRFPPTDALPPKLVGISVMGTRFAVCEYSPADRAFLHPLVTPPGDPENLADTATPSRERWQYDILEEDGEAKIKQIAAELKEMATTVLE